MELLIERGYYKTAFDLYDDYFLVKQTGILKNSSFLTPTQKKLIFYFHFHLFFYLDLKDLGEKAIEFKQNLEHLLNIVISTNTQLQMF